MRACVWRDGTVCGFSSSLFGRLRRFIQCVSWFSCLSCCLSCGSESVKKRTPGPPSDNAHEDSITMSYQRRRTVTRTAQ